jgi:hypothetical protein
MTMASAFKCALTGKLAEGDGIRHVDVPVKNGEVVLRVTVYTRRDKQTLVQDVMGEEAAAAIGKALEGAGL